MTGGVKKLSCAVWRIYFSFGVRKMTLHKSMQPHTQPCSQPEAHTETKKKFKQYYDLILTQNYLIPKLSYVIQSAVWNSWKYKSSQPAWKLFSSSCCHSVPSLLQNVQEPYTLLMLQCCVRKPHTGAQATNCLQSGWELLALTRLPVQAVLMKMSTYQLQS